MKDETFSREMMNGVSYWLQCRHINDLFLQFRVD